MKQWAAKVEQLNIRCPECQRIAHASSVTSPSCTEKRRTSNTT